MACSLKRCITSDPALPLFTSYWSRPVSQLVWLQVWHVFLFLNYKTRIEPRIASQQIHLIKKNQNKQQVIRVFVHRVAITSHSDRALRSPAGRSHVRRWLQQETLTILLQARACVATLRVPAEKGGGAFHQSPSPRSLLLAVGSGRTALWYFYDVREAGACWGGQEVLNRRNAPEDSPAAADGSQRPLGPFEGSVRSPAVFVWARWLCERVGCLSAAPCKTRFDAS